MDIQLKLKIGRAIDRMKKDRANGRLIAGRLRFKNYKEFYNADHGEIVKRFFSLMITSPKRKKTVRNADYLKLALLLALLFAHLDYGMELINKDISGDTAKLYYFGNGFKMAASFIYRNDRWFLTEGSLIK